MDITSTIFRALVTPYQGVLNGEVDLF